MTATARALPFLAAVLGSLVVLFSPASGLPPAFPGTDKLVHVVVFGALAVTGRWAGLPWRGLAAGLVAYAIGSELVQGALPLGRSPDALDVLADVAGAAAGLLLVRLRLRLRARRR